LTQSSQDYLYEKKRNKKVDRLFCISVKDIEKNYRQNALKIAVNVDRMGQEEEKEKKSMLTIPPSLL
jgi:polysaccharide deacetylase 2 family uncharacterized protein YibQ